MPNPTLIKGTYYLVVQTPFDVLSKAKGLTIGLPVDGAFYYRKVGSVVKVSLRTKEPAEAKRRFVQAHAVVEAFWENLRKGPYKLSHKQCVALAGELYNDFIRVSDDDPGPPDMWEQVRRFDHEALIPKLTPIQTLMIPTPKPSADKGIEERFGGFADVMLRRYGLVVDEKSRWNLVLQVAAALNKATKIILQKAKGDYSDTGETTRFPQFVPPTPITPIEQTLKTTEEKQTGLTLTGLFELWEKDHLANGKSPRTVKDFKHKVQSLIHFLGHDDAFQVTPEAIADWCDDLRHKQGVSARTVSQKYLSVIKLIYQIGVEKRKVKDNPAKDNKVRYEKPKRTRSAGFTDEEAQAILQATFNDPAALGRRSEENKRAIRWLPWLCAFTGSRISEAAQLRTEDFFEQHGIPCLRITPEAGSVKTGNFRIVPIHPQLLDMGLLQMVRGLPEGPLFYSLRPRRGLEADPVERAQNAGAKVREWIRDDLGITDPRVQPNHAWRHRFKTVAREIGMDVEIRDAIQGHEDGRAASDYGEVTIKAMWNWVRKMPYYLVGETTQEDAA